MTPRNSRELAARRYVDRWCLEETRQDFSRYVLVFRDELRAVCGWGYAMKVAASAPSWVSLARKLGWDGRVKR